MDKSYYYFGSILPARADGRLDNDTLKELWSGFCCQAGELSLTPGGSCRFEAGETEPVALPEGAEYALRVTEKGLSVAGRGYPGLVRGLMVLMLRIEPTELEPGRESFRIECCELESSYSIATRMIHFCVFPETSPLFLKRCLRLAGVMQYTHVVLEFWGTLRFECMRELSWPAAFSKAQARDHVREIEDMGMEAVPMFNHLGHAAACRVSGGKHVVLDQNPRLACLFAPDGWSWNIDSERAAELLTRVRSELYEIFPHSQYIHLGCDEVYSYERGEEAQSRMRRYLAELLERVHGEGRRPIIWGDMLLNREALGLDDSYFCGCDTPENAARLLELIPRYTVIGDWHYDVTCAPIKSSVFLKEQGFDVLGTPWFNYDNCQAHADTVRDYGLMGIMVSTWHTLAERMPHIVKDAIICGARHSPWSGGEGNTIHTETAALLRKLCPADGDYAEAGWTDAQVFRQARPMV